MWRKQVRLFFVWRNYHRLNIYNGNVSIKYVRRKYLSTHVFPASMFDRILMTQIFRQHVSGQSIWTKNYVKIFFDHLLVAFIYIKDCSDLSRNHFLPELRSTSGKLDIVAVLLRLSRARFLKEILFWECPSSLKKVLFWECPKGRALKRPLKGS